jgi:predicted  nucleic acid-binding Zn-ribbon protein
MPHQCLKCGHVFEEGSSQLLKGCPGCGGNRFFFTKQPLNELERDVMSKEIGQDLTTRIMELAVEKHKETLKGAEPISDDDRKAIINKIKAEADHSDRPETIEVEQPGKYDIDLKGLLEKEPIVIQKDGTYTIHLPSLFKMREEKKK